VDESTWLYPLTSNKKKIRYSDANAIPIETTDWKNAHRAPILSIGRIDNLSYDLLLI